VAVRSWRFKSSHPHENVPGNGYYLKLLVTVLVAVRQ
jgi:hypothetical protein